MRYATTFALLTVYVVWSRLAGSTFDQLTTAENWRDHWGY